MVGRGVYLLIGEDELSKRQKIESLKVKALDKGLRGLDFESLYANDKNLRPAEFDEILSYGPSEKGAKRIILIRKIESLPSDCRPVLLRHLKNHPDSVIIILETELTDKKNPFLKELTAFAKPAYATIAKKENVFDLARAIEQQNVPRALEILNSLLNNREKPLRILGGIYWYWDKMREELSLDRFRKGLRILLDTDLRIKTSAIKENIALELLVIRLSYLAR